MHDNWIITVDSLSCKSESDYTLATQTLSNDDEVIKLSYTSYVYTIMYICVERSTITSMDVCQ